MPDLTPAERQYADAELSFARWISALGGWVHADTVDGVDGSYSQVARNWTDGHHVSAGRLRRARKDRADVVELTDAGRAWCREHGIG
jgi:hypothetical protein